MKKIHIITLLLALIALPMSAQHAHHNRNDHHEHHDKPVVVHHGHIGDREDIVFASPSQVNEIIFYLKSISFDKDRLKAAMLCVKLCPIAAEDLGRIIQTFTFEDGRIKFLCDAYPYCPDKQHYREAVNQLSFLSSRDKVYRHIERHYRD